MSAPIKLRDITPPTPPGDDSFELYASRRHVYTRAFSGLFRNVRRAAGIVLLAVFFITAWLQHDGHQAVWWNLPERQFYIFGATFWPQDFILLSGLLIVAAFGLFFITVYAGRVWCGYTCPQSLWTWMFMWCEQITEGDRQQRIKLDNAPMSANKLLRKTAKHSLWILMGLATGLTFVGYFAPIRELSTTFFTGAASGWVYFWTAFVTVATYGNAGWLREQVCIYMCPYARFQSVMFDKDTLIVSYDPGRGEARGPRRKDSERAQAGLGDCIDCTLCVQVCPTGIDIRDGLQIECIGCAACIDACDSIMDRMNYPRGLISYTTEHKLAGAPSRIVRPRLLAYAAVLLVLLGLLAQAFIQRPLDSLDVSKDRQMYREDAQGRIENVYSLKIMNKDQRMHRYHLGASGPEGLQLQGKSELSVAAGEIASVIVTLSAPPKRLQPGAQNVVFTLDNLDRGTRVQSTSRFTAPSSLARN